MNRKDRRAERSARGRLKALQGGRQLAPDTPAQRLGADLFAFLGDYLKKHGGLDQTDVVKVLMQLSVNIALDHAASREGLIQAIGDTWDEEEQARAERRKY